MCRCLEIIWRSFHRQNIFSFLIIFTLCNIVPTIMYYIIVIILLNYIVILLLLLCFKFNPR